MARKSRLFFWKARKGYYSTINGKQIRFGDTLAEATPAFKAALKAAECRVAVKGSLAEWMDVFLEHVKQTKAEATYRLYAKFVNSFCQFNDYGNRHISQVRANWVLAWVAAHPKWKGSKRTAITTIKTALAFLIKDQKCIHRDDLDMSLIKRPAKTKRMKWVSSADRAAILALIHDQKFRDVLEYLYHTGCRPYELYRLRNRHLDLNNSRAVIPCEEMPSHKTGGEGKDRVIYFDATALEIVMRLAGDNPEGFVFLNRSGKPWTIESINSRFERIKDRLGKRFSPYAYRHGFGTRKVAEGNIGDLKVAALMGHSDLSMLKGYYDHSAEVVANMIEAANA